MKNKEEKRLIDANALKKALKSNCDTLCNDKNTNWCEHCCPLNDFEDLIDNAPTISPSLTLNFDNITEEDIKKFKIIWQRATSKGLFAVKEERQKDRWVSVSEQLPPNYVLCLFCDKDGNVFYGHRKPNNLWFEEFQPGNVPHVVAWQELPEPYKEGGME